MRCYYCGYETGHISYLKGKAICLECQNYEVEKYKYNDLTLNTKSATVGSKNLLAKREIKSDSV
jgi:recombinational DNA repair protein (RecF pathway)